MKKKTSFIFLSILFSAYSCEPVSEINDQFENFENRIVLDSYFSDRHTAIRIFGFRSVNVLEPVYFYEYKYRLDGLTFKLFENGAPVEKFETDKSENCVYFLNYQTKAGNNYEIKAFCEGFNEVSSKTYIPIPVSISKIESEQIASLIKATIKISDPPSENNYYYFTIDYLQGYNIYFEYFDPLLNFSINSNIHNINLPTNSVFNEPIYFSDKFFNGKDYQFDVHIPVNDNQNSFFYEIAKNGKKVALYFKLFSLSKDYFMFEQSFNLALKVKDDRYAEPVNVYNNINHGFGRFAGYSVYIDSLEIESIVFSK